jgi:hypothetical protein
MTFADDARRGLGAAKPSEVLDTWRAHTQHPRRWPVSHCILKQVACGLLLVTVSLASILMNAALVHRSASACLRLEASRTRDGMLRVRAHARHPQCRLLLRGCGHHGDSGSGDCLCLRPDAQSQKACRDDRGQVRPHLVGGTTRRPRQRPTKVPHPSRQPAAHRPRARSATS